MDRVEGKDANNILQSYTDVRPGPPHRRCEHRDPIDDLRQPYDRRTAEPITKLNAIIITGAEHQAHDYYMNVGPTFRTRWPASCTPRSPRSRSST